jgi:hypothetical protein
MTFDMDGPFSASQKASWRTCTGKRPAVSAGVHYEGEVRVRNGNAARPG